MAELDNEGIRRRIENESGGNQWTIELHAYEVVDTPFTEPIVHFEVVFAGPDGEMVNVLNGDPYEKGSGEHAGGLRAGSDDNVLKTSYGSGGSFDKTYGSFGDRSGKEPLTAYKLWEGGTSEFFELRNRAREAGAVINSLDVDYLIIDPFREAQNSNSVVGTVVTAMGLEIPREAEAIWAPGLDRHLLPSDFKSYFDFFPITDENFAEFLPRQSADAREGIHAPYTAAIFNPLDRSNIIEGVQNLKPLEDGERISTFDPNDNKTPEGFGQSAAHQFMHDNGIGHHHGNNDFKHSH